MMVAVTNRRRAPVMWVLAAALVPAGSAAAQGTSGSLPGPISSRDLAHYAERLKLSSEQRQALEPVFEEYRNDFRQLREGEIENFLEGVSGMWARGFRGLNREAVEDSLHQKERVMSRIRLLDERLFDHIESVLEEEEQAVALPRVMQARDRQRYRTGATRMVGYVNRAARVDLSRLYEDLELAAAQREETEPFIIQYEGRLTRATRDLYEASARIFLEVIESLEEQGVVLGEPADGDDRRAMRQAMMTAWGEASKKPREKAAAISDLNHQALRQITPLLVTEQARTLRVRYLRLAYPEVPTTRGTAERSFRAAGRLNSIPEALRSDIETSEVQFRESRDAVIDEMVEFIDEYRRNWSPMETRREARQEYEQKLETFRQRLTELDESTAEALYALLGARLAESVKIAATTDDLEEPAGLGRPDATRSAREATAATAAAAVGPDPFLPQPISTRDVRTYVERLGLAESDRFILESLHDDYLASYRALSGTRIAALHAAKSRLLQGDGEGEGPSVEQIDKIYGLRSTALQSILQLDASFFDDIETLIASPEQAAIAQRLRLERQRLVYNRRLDDNVSNVLFGDRGGRRRWRETVDLASRESNVDLAGLVGGIELEGAQRKEVETLLADYEAAAAAGFHRQYNAITALRREAEKLAARQRREADDGDRRQRWRQRFEAYQKLMEEQGSKAADTRKAMADLNRATLSALVEALPSAQAETLRDAYNVAAFPQIYGDPKAADRFLAAALDLSDLSSEQRSGIEAILQEYRPARRQLSDQMAEIYADSTDEPATAFDRARWRADEERRNRLSKLRFDRDEVNAKALRQLRALLTERQQARIRLPDELADEPDDEQAS